MRWFQRVQTQWRFAGMTGRAVGLDHTACEAAARMMGLEMTGELFACLCLMEDEALRVFNE